MARRLISRIALGALVVFIVATLAFVLQFVVPNDPAKAVAPRAKGAALERIREQLHLNDPLLVQFERYFSGLLHGDFGTSYVEREPVSTLIAQRLPATALLAGSVVLVELAFGTGLGLLAVRRRSWAKVVDATNLVLISAPEFTIALLLILVFGFRFRIFPVTGGFGLPQLVLPTIALALSGCPGYALVVREEFVQSLSSPYVRTAIAKGVSDRRIVRSHTMRNVYPPMLTMAGLDLASLLSGVAIIESVFGWPGIGQLAVNSFSQEDRPVAMAVVIVGATAVVVFNIAVDFLNMYMDPRTREVAS